MARGRGEFNENAIEIAALHTVRENGLRNGRRHSGARVSANHDVQLHIGESRDSPMRNCASEVWSFGPSRNDGEDHGFAGWMNVHGVASESLGTSMSIR